MSNPIPIFETDAGGNSTLTRLKAEVEYNKAKDGYALVTDSSLTHGDLRNLLFLLTEFYWLISGLSDAASGKVKPVEQVMSAPPVQINETAIDTIGWSPVKWLIEESDAPPIKYKTVVELSKKIGQLVLDVRKDLITEQAAHDEIAKLCFAAGAETPDGTSIGAVKDLIRRYHISVINESR